MVMNENDEKGTRESRNDSKCSICLEKSHIVQSKYHI